MVEQDRSTDHARALLAEVARYGPTLVAFSGGVDSGLVLVAAVRALGVPSTAAVTAVSPSLPAAELEAAQRFCAEHGVRHHLVRTDELDLPGYRRNGRQRCYFCKSTVLDAARTLADRLGVTTVATGTNASDLREGFRPGIAAGAERGVRTPLADAGLDKAAVRAVARRWGLATWDKPAMACLSSRVAHGLEITPSRLARIERAETAVRQVLGPRAGVDLRVRDLGDQVRVELDPETLAAVGHDPRLVAAVRDAGFGALPVTTAVFRSGSLNTLRGTAVPG